MPTTPFEESIVALDHAHRIGRAFVAELGSFRAGTSIDARELEAALSFPLPVKGCSASDALDDWMDRAGPGITGSPGPRNFGFVIGGSTPAALAADWLTSAIDQNSGLWVASPAATQTDIAALEWLKELFGLPSSWAGSLTSGATHAHLVGLAAARQWAGKRMGFDPAMDGLGGNPAIPVISSTEIHASAVKSLSTLGFGRRSVKKLPAVRGAIDLTILEQTMAGIRTPVIVIANAGEVNTGAFDDLVAIADLCALHEPGAWLHVDAAFGLYGLLSDRTAHLLDGIERADSVCADAHKWLNVPYDSGFAFVADSALLHETFSTRAAYLEPPEGAGPDLDGNGPFFSTRFRGLAIWCALRSYGKQGYRAMVDRCLDNAAAFGAWLEGDTTTELLSPVNLNMVCWRYRPTGLTDAETDDFNREAVTRIQRDGRVFLTPTVWDGKQAIRCAFDNWATSSEDVRILQEAIQEIGEGLLHP